MGVVIDPAIAVGVKHKWEIMQIFVFHITDSDPPASRCEALRAGVQSSRFKVQDNLLTQTHFKE
jgi:hypothetical protein